jgi:ribosomal-protein-alanine N-acetyltransferase
MSTRPVILPMRPSDLDAVCRIADVSFPVAWTREEFEKELTRTYAVMRVLRPSLGEPVCAFANYWCIGDEVQLMNVATAPAQRGHGFARALLLDLIAHARERRATLITLEVRRGNTPARALYKAYGFTEEGVRPRYYSDNAEDAIVMHLALAVARATT